MTEETGDANYMCVCVCVHVRMLARECVRACVLIVFVFQSSLNPYDRVLMNHLKSGRVKNNICLLLELAVKELTSWTELCS